MYNIKFMDSLIQLVYLPLEQTTRGFPTILSVHHAPGKLVFSLMANQSYVIMANQFQVIFLTNLNGTPVQLRMFRWSQARQTKSPLINNS